MNKRRDHTGRLRQNTGKGGETSGGRDMAHSFRKTGGQKGRQIPPRLEALIEEYIHEKTGKEIRDPAFLARLRQSVSAQKAAYWNDKPGKTVRYGKAYDIFAYLAYHLPVYYTQFLSLLRDLERDQVLPEHMRVLDIGTGPGVVPLALISFWRECRSGSLEIFSLERSEEHREAYLSLVRGYAADETCMNIHPPMSGDLVQIAAEGIPGLPSRIHLLTFQNVLAELQGLSTEEKAGIVERYASTLEDDGMVIIVEPAELRHAEGLRRLQRELRHRGYHVYAPCSYPWGCGCGGEACWTFREESPISPPTLMTLLAGENEGYRYLNTDVKYAYLICSKHPRSRYPCAVPPDARMHRLSYLKSREGRRVSVIAARMSEDIGPPGMHIFKICDGTCRDPVYAVLSRRSVRPSHQPLFDASYGEILTFSGALVRRHPRHPAWNLILDPDSHVSWVTGGNRPAGGGNERTSPDPHPHNGKRRGR